MPTFAPQLADPVPVQLLTPAGDLVDHPDVVRLLDPDQVRAAYRDLVLVRRLDQEATALQRRGELGLWAPCLGQEAAQVGSARALAGQDYAFPTYRDHGVAWCRGVEPLELLRMFRGVTHGGWNPQERGCHLYTIVIGAQTLHATGYAMGVQRDGAVGTGDPDRDTAVIAYFGDGASAQGDVNEAFVFAGVTNAPVVFFCENNQWAISEPNERQTRVPIVHRAAGFGFPGIRVDGNDLLAVHAVTTAALDRARGGEGPVLIEALTYRMGAHTTSDDPSRYRPAAEVAAWQARDPLSRVRVLLEREGTEPDFFTALDAEAEALGEQLRADCLTLPDPAPESLFDHVYHEPHAGLARERSAFRRYQATLLPAPEVAR